MHLTRCLNPEGVTWSQAAFRESFGKFVPPPGVDIMDIKPQTLKYWPSPDPTNPDVQQLFEMFSRGKQSGWAGACFASRLVILVADIVAKHLPSCHAQRLLLPIRWPGSLACHA